MSNPYQSHLPPEILDYIIDLLRDEPGSLRQCSIVSKSWVPRTRERLFGHIEFRTVRALEAWKKTFPDPTYSPACHARMLSVWCPQVVTEADGQEGGWIRTFSCVVRLEMWLDRLVGTDTPEVPLTPFHNFSPVLKSLRVDFAAISYPQIHDLICSLPLLEDLCLIDNQYDDRDHDKTAFQFQPSTSPVLAGTLELSSPCVMGRITRRLLDVPNGLHFRKLVWTWYHEEHTRWMTALMAECSDTLECIDIKCRLTGTFLRLLRQDQYVT